MPFAELKVADSNPGRDDQFPARAERENIPIVTFRGKLGETRAEKANTQSPTAVLSDVAMWRVKTHESINLIL